MQVNDVIQASKYCSLSIVMQVNDVIQVIKTIVRYLLLCKLMMLYKTYQVNDAIQDYCSLSIVMQVNDVIPVQVIYCYAS